MKLTLTDDDLRELSFLPDARGSSLVPLAPERQPISTLYGGGHLFRSDIVRRVGELALSSLSTYAPDAAAFRLAMFPTAIAPNEERAGLVLERVREKLRREPVEDLRIDFEDGFGPRGDAEEDATAERCAETFARAADEASLPAFTGIRIRSFGPETRARAMRTLDLFLSTFTRMKGVLPRGFAITLPKVTSEAEVAALAELCDRFEKRLVLEPGSLRIEIMVETTEALFDDEGRVPLPRFVRAARGRCVGAHLGTYDLTASCDVGAPFQTSDHPLPELARSLMQITLAGRGVGLSDGATNVLPVPKHKIPEGGVLSQAQKDDNQARVHEAWQIHVANVRRALVRGLYQGWDLHPAQLPARYAAVYAFFLEGFDASARRLSTFLAESARASLTGTTFDDAATGRGLVGFFSRGIRCGAFTRDEVDARLGVDFAALEDSPSFARMTSQLPR